MLHWSGLGPAWWREQEFKGACVGALLSSAGALVVAGMFWSAQVSAQEQPKPFLLAQAAQGKAAAPKRAQPVPPKPVSEEETARAARINNWTVGLAGGLLEGTFVRYAADRKSVV